MSQKRRISFHPYTSIDVEGNRLAVDDCQGIHCCLLLGFFFSAAPRGGIMIAPDDCGEFEALAVVWPLLVEQMIGWSSVEFLLRHLLKQRFVVSCVSRLGDFLDFAVEVIEDEFLGWLQTAVEIHRADERLVDVRQEIGWYRGLKVHSLAEEEKVTEIQEAAQASASAPADDCRLELGEVPLLLVGKAQIELFAANQAEHGIPEKFQPFVGIRARIGTGGVRKGRPQQVGPAEAIADRALAHLQDFS